MAFVMVANMQPSASCLDLPLDDEVAQAVCNALFVDRFQDIHAVAQQGDADLRLVQTGEDHAALEVADLQQTGVERLTGRIEVSKVLACILS